MTSNATLEVPTNQNSLETSNSQGGEAGALVNRHLFLSALSALLGSIGP